MTDKNLNTKNNLKMNLQYFAKDPSEEEETTEPEPKDKDPVDPEPDPKPEPKEPEPKDPEPKPEPEPKEPEDNSEELEELREKLEKARGFKEKYNEAKSYKEKYDKAQEELKGYEDSLSKIAESKIKALPENFQGLVPDGTTQEKLDWLAKAEESGVLSAKEEKSIGSSSKTNQKEEVKVEDMSANQKLMTGIKDFYSRRK